MVSVEVQFADVRRIPQGARVFGESGSYWGVIKASTVALPSNGAVEHPAKYDTIDGSGMDAEPNDPARVLIHDDQYPVGLQRGRFAPER